MKFCGLNIRQRHGQAEKSPYGLCLSFFDLGYDWTQKAAHSFLNEPPYVVALIFSRELLLCGSRSL
jgi:hypothetical protein